MIVVNLRGFSQFLGLLYPWPCLPWKFDLPLILVTRYECLVLMTLPHCFINFLKITPMCLQNHPSLLLPAPPGVSSLPAPVSLSAPRLLPSQRFMLRCSRRWTNDMLPISSSNCYNPTRIKNTKRPSILTSLRCWGENHCQENRAEPGGPCRSYYVWAMDDVVILIMILMVRKNPANCCRALTPWEGEPTITSLQQVTGVIMLMVYELKICKGTGGWAWPGNVVPVESTLPSARFSIG